MLAASPSHTTTPPEVPIGAVGANARAATTESANASLRRPRIILGLIAAFSLLGVGFALWLRTVPAGNPDPRFWFNVFYVLFARNEPLGLALVAIFSLSAALLFFRKGNEANVLETLDHPRQRGMLPVIAITVFAVAAAGTQFVFHDYLLTADENLADFQARIFLRGQVQAEVPAAWAAAANAIRPTHTDYSAATHLWNTNYLPVYAAMRAAFEYFDLQALLNPFLTALTILAFYGTARNIWPESKTNALVAIGLLASSSQFLVMSMTAYAMPAHLALNTIWLWLYSQSERRAFYLAPVVGVLAIGLHQPVVHALFVLPFLARLVFQRRWRPVLIFGAIYLAGCVVWYVWKTHFRPPPMPGQGAWMFRLANPRMAIIQPMNLLLIIAWASLATPLLALLGFKQVFKAPPIVQDAVLSCALTFGFYYFFYFDQAHGWGYRYFHGVLACLIIVAVAGSNRLSILVGQRRALTFVVTGIALSILVQLPLRCIQAERFVRPYAHAAEALHAIPADIVALNPLDAWYSADLIRNDPFLEQRPVIVSLFRLTPSAVAALEKNGSARFITRDELARFGLFTTRRDHYGRDPFQLGQGQ